MSDEPTEYSCADCGIAVVIILGGPVPDDGLCCECRVIAQARPEDREKLARIFKKEIHAR